MGGGNPGSSPSAPPAPPSAGETSRESIQAQIDALPEIFRAQSQYGPQFSQLQLDQLRQFGPQFADEALKLRDKISPESGAASRSLADYLGGNDQSEFDALKPGLVEDVRAGQSARGFATASPLGAIDESVQIQRLKSSLKDRRLNVALSTAGRQPLGGINGTTGTGQLVQNIDPSSFFGYQGNVNNYGASIFNSQAGIFGSQMNNSGSVFGSLLGGFAGGASGAAGTAAGTAAIAAL